MKTTMEMNGHDLIAKANALAVHLGVATDEVARQICDHYGLTAFEVGGAEYAIGSDAECDRAARENMEQSIWAFNAEFILSACNLPSELADGLRAWQEKECEGCNDDLLRMVNRLAGYSFFASAISADGRGHFLSGYDGNENEQGEFFIYRTN